MKPIEYTAGLNKLYDQYVKVSAYAKPDKYLALDILYMMRDKINAAIEIWEKDE
jgi:hypothetical protein